MRFCLIFFYFFFGWIICFYFTSSFVNVICFILFWHIWIGTNVNCEHKCAQISSANALFLWLSRSLYLIQPFLFVSLCGLILRFLSLYSCMFATLTAVFVTNWQPWAPPLYNQELDLKQQLLHSISFCFLLINSIIFI